MGDSKKVMPKFEIFDIFPINMLYNTFPDSYYLKINIKQEHEKNWLRKLTHNQKLTLRVRCRENAAIFILSVDPWSQNTIRAVSRTSECFLLLVSRFHQVPSENKFPSSSGITLKYVNALDRFVKLVTLEEKCDIVSLNNYRWSIRSGRRKSKLSVRQVIVLVTTTLFQHLSLVRILSFRFYSHIALNYNRCSPGKGVCTRFECWTRCDGEETVI